MTNCPKTALMKEEKRSKRKEEKDADGNSAYKCKVKDVLLKTKIKTLIHKCSLRLQSCNY